MYNPTKLPTFEDLNKDNLFLSEDSSIYMRITTLTVVSFLLGKSNVLQRSLVCIPNRAIERKALLISMTKSFW